MTDWTEWYVGRITQLYREIHGCRSTIEELWTQEPSAEREINEREATIERAEAQIRHIVAEWSLTPRQVDTARINGVLAAIDAAQAQRLREL